MRIAVDARAIYSPSRRGTGKNLVDLYSTLAAQRKDWEFLMLYQTNGGADPLESFPNIRARRIDIRGDRWNLWQDVRLPAATVAHRADLLHCPANTSPRQSITPVVVTIHDLIPLEIAPDADETQRWLRRVGRAASYARRIITPSEYSRRMITRHLKMPAEKITVNYWAPDRNCRRVTDTQVLAATRRKYGVDQYAGHVLAFGAEDPRKNTMAIIEAWAQLDSARRRAHALLIVGLQPAALSALRTFTADRVHDSSCVLHGFADEADVPALVSGATALCYPSRSEGFGLPVLDAFLCGAPVITSATTSLPEVAGDAAVLVDPDDRHAIARALADVVGSPDLQEQLRQKGYRRVERFSWDRCARTAATAFEAAVARSR